MSERTGRRLLGPILLALALVAFVVGLVAVARAMTERSAQEVEELVRKVREEKEGEAVDRFLAAEATFFVKGGFEVVARQDDGTLETRLRVSR